MKREYIRLKEKLREAEPGSELYSTLLDQLDNVFYLASKEESLNNNNTAEEKTLVQFNNKPDETVTEEQDTKQDIKQEETGYTKESLRALLTDASREGVKIQDIMSRYIPTGMPNKLSSVPIASYAELAKEINNAR